MINFTLTITATPELLAAISSFTNSIKNAKVVAIPEPDSVFKPVGASQAAQQVSQNQQHVQVHEPAGAVPVYNQIGAVTVNPGQAPGQASPNQQMARGQASAGVVPLYNPSAAAPVNSPQNPMQPPRQAAVQTMLDLPPVQAPVVPTSNRTYTMQQLAVAATQLVDAGRRQELVGLLNSFGVQAMTALPKEQYGAFAAQLRRLGAKM